MLRVVEVLDDLEGNFQTGEQIKCVVGYQMGYLGELQEQQLIVNEWYTVISFKTKVTYNGQRETDVVDSRNLVQVLNEQAEAVWYVDGYFEGVKDGVGNNIA